MIQKTRKLFLVGACLGLTAFGFGPVVFRESKLSAQNYAYAYGAWAMSHLKDTSDKRLDLVVPSVDIYDSSGATIYHGQKVENDVGVLENLPQRVQGLRASGLRPSLSEALEMFPELAKEKSSILSAGRYSVISITASAGCPKCGRQDEAIAKLKRLAARANINVLEVRLFQ
jgi:hypothetical protein